MKQINKIKLVQYFVKKDLPHDDVRKIHHRFLCRDPSWHFFHEGDYCLFRVTPGMCEKEIQRFLTKKKIDFTVSGYEDPQEHVRKYQDLFIPIFHSYTILGLTAPEEDMRGLLDRITHCFFNIVNKDLNQEAIMLAQLYTSRVLFAANYSAQMTVQSHINYIERTRITNPEMIKKSFSPKPSEKKK